MRRRLLLLLPVLLLLASGCAVPHEHPTEAEVWLDAQSAAGPGPSGGGLLDGVSDSAVGLGGLESGAYDATFSCFGTSVRFAFEDRDLDLDCSESRVERMQAETALDVRASSEDEGAWYVRLAPAEA
ncbi:hypothetical protein [Arenivirga flava]|uniref:DUF306 domain-containing protein n=1 Tax=Arenivirga flava TaxID=1930060 RepID=A0AA37UDE7_9MICO|nr:hypothetical protein [Arenivirga flava]GMA28419.1 hypothetical protein GCM10025874_16720 [Arenivirga flava]